MRIIGIIPARYQSSRLPGKPLKDICGKPMIWWVYQQVKKVKDKSLSTKDKSSIRTDSSQDASEEEVNIVVGAMPEE